MKKIFKHIVITVFGCSALTSCTEDDVTDLSTIDYSTVTVTLTSSENDITIDETTIDADRGYTITITATINNPLPIDIVIPLTQTGGTATAEDYSLESIRIPSSLTSASTTVIIYKTGNTEGNETFSIGAAPNKIISNANVNPFSLNVSIENDYVDYNATFTFDWSGSVFSTEDGAETFLEFCKMDIDFYLLNNTFEPINEDAATLECPENFTIDTESMADGTYYIYTIMYSNPYYQFYPFDNPIEEDVPITISYTQGYQDSMETGAFVPSFKFTTNSRPNDPIFGDGEASIIAEIIINGTEMTVNAL